MEENTEKPTHPERVVTIEGRVIGPMEVSIPPVDLSGHPSHTEQLMAAARAVVIACRKLGSTNRGWRAFGADQFWHGASGVRMEWLDLLLQRGWIEPLKEKRSLFMVTDSFVEFWYGQDE